MRGFDKRPWRWRRRLHFLVRIQIAGRPGRLAALELRQPVCSTSVCALLVVEGCHLADAPQFNAAQQRSVSRVCINVSLFHSMLAANLGWEVWVTLVRDGAVILGVCFSVAPLPVVLQPEGCLIS